MTDSSEEDLRDLLDLLRIPSHAGNAEAKKAAALHCETLLRRSGFDTTLCGPSDAPAVVATLTGTGSGSLLFYNHYDVVAPGDTAQWDRDPFGATLDGDHLVARGASDHKASFVARLAAVRKLRDRGGLPVGVSFLIDGEEEIGSPNLEDIILSQREHLRANGGLYSGGARAEDGSMVIRAGCKGRCGIRLTVRTSERDNHSKWAAVLPSAAWRLIATLAALRKDGTGDVLVEKFHDGIEGPDREDEAALDALDFDRAAFLRSVGHSAFRPDAAADPLRALMFAPTFNIAWLGCGTGSGTVLPGSASALLDIRLVPGQTAQGMFELVRRHLAARGFGDVELEMEGASDPDKCDLSDPVVRALQQACEIAGAPCDIHPMGAGSGPRHLFRRHLGFSLVQDPGCSWAGSNDHAANENIMVPHFHQNRELIADFLVAFSKMGRQAPR